MSRSWRSAVPTRVKQFGRTAYVTAGRHLRSPRHLPDFVLIGAQRAGTTSLFRALMQHPDVIRPAFHKGVNYFDVNYHRGPQWYAAHFPIAATPRVRSHSHGSPTVFEASGYYLYHPLAVERLAKDLPDVKVVAMLRDPVERAYSAWKHESARGFETADFETALAEEDHRLEGEIPRILADPTYESFAHRHQSYRHRGQYAEQLERVLEHIPAARLHVMYSEDFFQDPAQEYARLCRFLELSVPAGVSFERYNARPSTEMPAGPRADLIAHFARERVRLEEIVGQPAPWP